MNIKKIINTFFSGFLMDLRFGIIWFIILSTIN